MRADEFLLADILHSIAEIRILARGKIFDDLRADTVLQRAIFFEIIALGEAAGRLSRSLCARHAEVPWRSVVGMRNRIVHEYFAINLTILWQTITQNLDPLEAQIREILKQEFPSFNPSPPQ